MDALQIYFIFFGLPLVILGLGMRRAIGAPRMLLLILVSTVIGLYGLLAEMIAAALGHGLPVPTHAAWGRARMLLPVCVAAAILGALGVVLIRCRTRGEGS